MTGFKRGLGDGPEPRLDIVGVGDRGLPAYRHLGPAAAEVVLVGNGRKRRGLAQKSVEGVIGQGNGAVGESAVSSA